MDISDFYSFSDLIALHGSEDQIPDETLYAFITREDVQKDLANRQNIGLDKFKEVPVVKFVRKKSKADLFWLARYMLWGTNPEGAGRDIKENKITRETHGQLCDFFVKKDDTKSLAEQDPVHKDRLLLYPRGGFKSTIDVCDVVQWILNFPDIRILFLTAADDLAIGFVEETKGHFLKRPENPSLMELFFPEYCVVEKEMDKENQYQFTCPLWAAKKIKRKEPTVLASSIVSTLSGKHFEIIKADDAVSNKNSETEEQCEKVTKNFYINRKMLRPFGYCDLIGTRYHDVDMYGRQIEANVGKINKKVVGPNLEFIENESTGQIMMIGRAIVIKPEVAERLMKEGRKVSYTEAGEEGCDLLIPSVLTYSFLMQEYAKDESSFEGQYNQNPHSQSDTPFTRALLVANTVPFEQMPFRGPISQTWDFAFSKKKGRDYCTGSSVIWNEKSQMYVHDLIRARFHHNDLAKAVVDFAMRYHPFVIGIEDAAGSKFLEPTIIREAEKTGDPHVIAVCSRIEWITVSNEKDAKRARMGSLHPWLENGQMKFANYLPFLDVCYDEFEKCMFSHHHDDIPDVLSHQPRYAPRMQQLIEKNEMQTWSQLDAGYNLLYGKWLSDNEIGADAFGRLGMGEPMPVVDIEPEPEVKSESYAPGLDAMLGGGLIG